jgi:hypothetical protein
MIILQGFFFILPLLPIRRRLRNGMLLAQGGK